MNRKHIIRNLRLKGIEFDENLSTKELNEILSTPVAVNRFHRSLNLAAGTGKIKVAFNAADPEAPAEISIIEDIGKDAWTGGGFGVKDIQDALDLVTPKTRPLNFLVDSPGGDVSTGTAIHNILLGWQGVINKTIIGMAASTASWCIPADKTTAFKNSKVFVHRAMTYTGGNVDDFQKAIDFLNMTDGQIAGMLSDQSGNDPEEMAEMMKGSDGQGTLMTGSQAKDCGMVDEVIDGNATNHANFDEWLNSAKKKLTAQNKISAPKQGAANQPNNQTQIMNKTQMLALLNKWGVTVPADATDEQIIELVNAGKPIAAVVPPIPAAANLDEHPTIKALNAQIAMNRRRDIQTAVDKAASDGKIPALEIENWVNDAVVVADHPTNGNPVLARLAKLENRAPGRPPVPMENTLEVGSSVKDLCKGFEAHNDVTAAWKSGHDISMKEIATASKNRAQFVKKHRNQMLPAMNSNAVPVQLQQQFIMQDVVIRDFARRVIGLDMFSTVFRNVPLLGLDTVEVQYYDLDSTASQAFAGNYDNLVSNSVGSSREITVGWGPNKDGALGVGHARLVQALSFSSQDFQRQPYLNIAQRAALKAEKLAFDIFQDVLGVITVANYPALLAAGNVITKTFDQFSSDDLADLKVACKAWPMAGRGLMLDSAYDGNLMKDPTFKAAYQQAFDSVKTQGKLNPELYSFGYTENPNIPSNGINLRGLAFWKYAILVAFAPVPPVDEVRRAGTTWELYTDEDSMVSLEYRTYGSNPADSATHIIESNYGFAPGLKTAIKPIVSP